MPESNRRIELNLVLEGLAVDALEVRQDLTGNTPEQIIKEALINNTEITLHAENGNKVYVGKKRKRKKLLRIPLYSGDEMRMPLGNIIFHDFRPRHKRKKGKI